MNITPQNPNLPIATVVNPQTDSLRRENSTREVISQPAAASQSAAEKGVASDRERARTPAQNNEFIDFVSIKEKAEQEDSTINGSSQQSSSGQQSAEQGNEQVEEQGAESTEQDTASDANRNQLSPEQTKEQIAEEKIIQELSARDAEVRRHENAHAATGGSVTGAPSYEFRKGPDGKSYAVSGEVSVDVSPVAGDPEATIRKMKKVHAAAMAPMNPSTQDIKVAATATNIILQAQSEIMSQAAERDNSNSRSENTVGRSRLNDGEERDFDTLINDTLANQEAIAPSESQRSIDVDQRAQRIETFYLKINKAYEQAPSHHFQIQA